MPNQHDWRSSIYGNEYVMKVYQYRREGRKDSVFELLRFIRDCIHHLMDYSVVMFCVEDKYLMIETCFPGLFHQFQRAMADGGFEDACLKEDEHGTVPCSLVYVLLRLYSPLLLCMMCWFNCLTGIWTKAQWTEHWWCMHWLNGALEREVSLACS